MTAPIAMRSRIFAAALLVAASGRPARAEVKTLTWEQCATIAAEANPDLAESRFSLESSRASFYQSFNGVFPKVTLSNSLSESRSAPGGRWSAEAATSVTLFSAASIASIRAASASVTLASAGVRRSSADLRQNLRQAFARLLFSQESLSVARTIAQLRERNAEMIALRYDSGSESKGNMLRTKAQALQARLSVVSAERDARAARREMSQRLGREIYDEFVATGTFGASAYPPHPDDFTALLPLRPESLSAEASVRRARAAVFQAESSLWPSLSGSYARTRSGGAEFPSAAYGWTTGLTLSYPLFGGGPTSTWYGVKVARRDLDAAERGLASAHAAGMTALENAWVGYANAVDQVEVQKALLSSARQRNDEADIKYASGLLSYDNWEPIVSERVSTESRILSAHEGAMNAETSWDRALGRALGE